MSEPSLMDLIQLHERKWGERVYPGRPSLESLMSSKVIAMWFVGPRFILTTHESVTELSTLIGYVLVGSDPIGVTRTLHRVYIDKRPTTFNIELVTHFADNKTVARQMPTPETLFTSTDDYDIPTGAFDALNLKPGRKVTMLDGRNVDNLPGRDVAKVKIEHKTRLK